jgi:hypothetical protein
MAGLHPSIGRAKVKHTSHIPHLPESIAAFIPSTCLHKWAIATGSNTSRVAVPRMPFHGVSLHLPPPPSTVEKLCRSSHLCWQWGLQQNAPTDIRSAIPTLPSLTRVQVTPVHRTSGESRQIPNIHREVRNVIGSRRRTAMFSARTSSTVADDRQKVVRATLT